MQQGFVIDHTKCIGCHACTVACKSENDVPVGKFRTWVKYTETGSFPTVDRHFAVLRCNQCTDAPCVTICPVHALEKRDDGIVDVDPARCIGCKSCMQACPYDALYINESTGTAEKCHFCAHRTEAGLAPACAVVCPTEAIIPGDFHDPGSRVSQLKQNGDLTARKTEAGTGPNVWYREAAPTGLDPSLTNKAGGYLWANQLPGVQLDAQAWESRQAPVEGRTTYDAERRSLWGAKVSGYLFTKSLAAGIFLSSFVLAPSMLPSQVAVLCSLFWLAVTTVLLVFDLKRPERFLYILRYANWSSWLTKGALVLMGYGAILTVAGFFPGVPSGPASSLAALGAVFAALTAGYTGWLFAQARGRVLWMRKLLWLELVVHAWVAGNAFLVILEAISGNSVSEAYRLPAMFRDSLVIGLILGLVAERIGPAKREKEFHRASRLVTHGVFARQHWIAGIGLGFVAPIALMILVPQVAPLAAALTLLGLYWEQIILVRAGQALPIS